MMRALAIILACLCVLAATPASAEDGFPTLLTRDGLFNEGELATIQRDSELAQRSGVPIMFAILPADATSVGSAQSVADSYRADYNVETEAGADDGIVFLVMWIADAPEKSTVVYSAGEHAFDTTGLSDSEITKYIDQHVLPLLHNGQLFDASAFLIRFTRATSLYVPPPPREISGVAKVAKTALAIVAPTAALGLIAALATNRKPTASQRWRTLRITLIGGLALAALSVWTHSRIGIVSLVIGALALAAWCLWVTRDPNQGKFNWKAIAPDALIVLLIFGASLGVNLQQVELTPGDRDETRWLNRAYYAVELDDPFGPTWQDYVTTVGQPPLGSIAIGIGLTLQGEDVRGTGVWDYQYGEDWYRMTGGYPTDEAMTAGRTTNAFIGAFASAAAYVLGRLLTNRIGGIAAGVYLAWHPLHIVLSTQALSDETFALLLLLSLIAAFQFASKPTWARAIALGILLGLGGATKLTPLLLAPPLGVFGALRLFADRTPAGKRAGSMLIAQPFIAFAAFVAIYPWLWENPIGRAYRLFKFRSAEMTVQTTAWPNALAEGPLESLARFGHKLTYTHSTSQKALQQIFDWVGTERTAVGFDLVLAAAGAVILLWYIARTGLWTPQALVAMLLFGELCILAIGMKADFYRYHLPVVMIVSACIAVSVGTAWSYAVAVFRRRAINESTEFSPEVAT